MISIIEKIKNNKVLLSDGAWGTSLQKMGLEVGSCPEKWNFDHPEKVKQVAREFIEAGSQLVKTNSFGGSRFKLEGYGLAGQAYEINKQAAALSREVAGDDIYVLASIGPSGKMILTGEVTPDELYEAFKEQAMALEEGGADVILVETMTDLEEAKLAVKAAKENTNCVVAATMTFSKDFEGDYKTMMGISISDMVPVLKEAGASLIGSNCGNGIKEMIDLVKTIRSMDDQVPVVIHANAGMPEYQDGETVFPETPDEMAGSIKDIVDAGANIIGGCCGTTPEHIRKMKEVLKNL